MMPFRKFTVLAATVITLAACGSDDGGDDGAATDSASGDGTTLEIEAGDLYFDPEDLSAEAGEITVALDNVGAVEHDFVIEEEGDEMVVQAAPGESATGTISLDAGSYTYYCSVPGHRTTMEGSLEVS